MIIARLLQVVCLALLTALLWSTTPAPAVALALVLVFCLLGFTWAACEIKRKRQLEELADVTAAIVVEASKQEAP